VVSLGGGRYNYVINGVIADEVTFAPNHSIVHYLPAIGRTAVDNTMVLPRSRMHPDNLPPNSSICASLEASYEAEVETYNTAAIAALFALGATAFTDVATLGVGAVPTAIADTGVVVTFFYARNNMYNAHARLIGAGCSS
jgi:hypothetical protein